MARKRRKPKRGSHAWEWEREAASLDGDYLPGGEAIAITKRYSSDVPAMSALTAIGAIIAAIGVYAYMTNKSPSPPVG